MRAINLASDQPSNRGADDHIRREMPLSKDSRGANSRGQPVRRNLSEWAWVLVGHDAGDRPGYGRMVRGKRDAMLKEVAKPLALVGALSSKRVLESCIHGETVDRRLARKDARLSLVLVV